MKIRDIIAEVENAFNLKCYVDNSWWPQLNFKEAKFLSFRLLETIVIFYIISFFHSFYEYNFRRKNNYFSEMWFSNHILELPKFYKVNSS